MIQRKHSFEPWLCEANKSRFGLLRTTGTEYAYIICKQMGGKNVHTIRFSLNNCYREHLFIKYDEIQTKAHTAKQNLASGKLTGNLADYKPISKDQAGDDLSVIEAYRKRSNVHSRPLKTPQCDEIY